MPIPEETTVSSPKSRGLILLSALFPCLRILDFFISWSLQPVCPQPSHSQPVLPCHKHEMSRLSSVVGYCISCVRNLSMYFRILLDCLHSVVLPSQQIWGWLSSLLGLVSANARLLPVVRRRPHLLLLKIIELLRLEKTSKIVKSNHQPITIMPAKPCPEVPYLCIFLTP